MTDSAPRRYQIVLALINGDKVEQISMIAPEYNSMTPMLGETLGKLIADAVRKFQPHYYREVLGEAAKWGGWQQP